jgi:hypothetical protein
MSTFVFRNDRRERVAIAIAAIGGGQVDLLPALEQELAALDRADWRVSDAAYLAVTEDWLLAFSDPFDLRDRISADPALRVFGAETVMADAQAAAVIAIPRPAGAVLPDYLDQVRAAVDNDDVVFNELVHAAHQQWIVQPESTRLHPFDDVGVLLPVRLETLFDEPGTEHNPDPDLWKLSLRVTPDEASIRRDSNYLSKGERSALIAFWRDVQQPGDPAPEWLDGELAAIAWKRLADKVTPARAAWLVSQIPVLVNGGSIELDVPADMREEPEPDAVGGFPAHLQVIVALRHPVDGLLERHVGNLPEDASKEIDWEALVMPLPRKLDNERTRWWASWARAREVGVGGEYLLPEGIEPENIRTLYVIGMGDESPGPHFRSQTDAGEFGLLRVGTPTNAVRDSTAPSPNGPGEDWRFVARVRLAARLDPTLAQVIGTGGAVQIHLTGGTEAFLTFPTMNVHDDTQLSQMMAAALWPALWGTWLRVVWRQPEHALRVAIWLIENVCPEGPLMPLRIGDQPYGVLPATALSSWEPEFSSDPELEQQHAVQREMTSILVAMRDHAAESAVAAGNVVGRSSTGLMEVLGKDALSQRYVQRHFTHPVARLIPYQPNANMVTLAMQTAQDSYHLFRDRYDVDAPTPYVPAGFWEHDTLPLVQPDRMLFRHQRSEERHRLPLSRFILLILELADQEDPTVLDLDWIFDQWWVLDEGSEWRLSCLPNSLLVRLVTYATQLATLWRISPTGIEPEGPALDRQLEAALWITETIDREEWRRESPDPITGLPQYSLEIPEDQLAQFERAFRATLDTASHRFDPWIMGFAWQRLRRTNLSSRKLHRMGVYGWVDDPFTGKPGPTRAGVLHTPSHAQTLAALIMRDKFITADSAGLKNERGDSPWQMDITSRKARKAEEIADEVRMGFHIYEVIGRQVEQVVAHPQRIRELRVNPIYAMREERSDPNEVCNGISALRGMLGNNPPIPVSPGQKEELQLLSDALDTYGDLLMADGIMQLVDRQIDRAAETMDAAAGFSRPPSFQFLRTPPSGYQLDTAVISALPFVPVDHPGVGDHPVRMADPSAASFVEHTLGSGWQWTIRDADNTILAIVDLDDLGLTPADALALPDALLRTWALRHSGVDGGTVEPPRQHQLARQVLAALGRRPALGRDLQKQDTPLSAVDAAIYDELRDRYLRVHGACSTLIESIETAADDDARRLLLRRALPWGAIPASRIEDQEGLLAALLNQNAPANSTSIADLAGIVADTLNRRFTAAPEPTDILTSAELAAPLPDHLDRQRAALPNGTASLAEAIAALASPTARLAVLGAWPKAELTTATSLTVIQPDTDLDEEWLTVLAATRADLARLEAVQLELQSPLVAWCNSPDDPWRTDEQNLIRKNLRQRETTSIAGLDMTRFVAAYGPDQAWSGERVAVGMIDAFAEAIPMPQRSTVTAFGFNAPASRPPQAILLAVPPRPRQLLDDAVILEIVKETRSLALARAAHVEDLGDLQAIVPTSWLLSNSPLRVRLERWPLYDFGMS